MTHPGRSAGIALAVGGLGLAASLAGFFLGREQFLHSWLVACAFWITLALGALFFQMLRHVTGAVWSVVVRRAAEAASSAFPLLFLLFLPVLFGARELYHWAQPAAAADHVMQWKAPYLNLPFFVVRAVCYFAVWTLLAWLLHRESRAQDRDRDPAHGARMRKISAAGMFLFAFTLTFAAFDWLMSLNPHWYSTMFGVYTFTGSFTGFLAVAILLYGSRRLRGALEGVVTAEHFHDLGRMLFAFTVFWAYIGGSQYFLIWYANIPEETAWFLARWEQGWKPVSLALILLHFAVPFVVLAFHAAKRNLALLRAMAALLVVMHYVDIAWLVLPSHGAPHPSWMDLAALAGIGGVVVWWFLRRLAADELIPVGDPHLADSIAHRV